MLKMVSLNLTVTYRNRTGRSGLALELGLESLSSFCVHNLMPNSLTSITLNLQVGKYPLSFTAVLDADGILSTRDDGRVVKFEVVKDPETKLWEGCNIEF
jgi:hypothetical protein